MKQTSLDDTVNVLRMIFGHVCHRLLPFTESLSMTGPVTIDIDASRSILMTFAERFERGVCRADDFCVDLRRIVRLCEKVMGHGPARLSCVGDGRRRETAEREPLIARRPGAVQEWERNIASRLRLDSSAASYASNDAPPNVGDATCKIEMSGLQRGASVRVHRAAGRDRRGTARTTSSSSLTSTSSCVDRRNTPASDSSCYALPPGGAAGRRASQASGEKKHVCVICSMVFTFATNLTRHQRKFHGRPTLRDPKKATGGATCASRRPVNRVAETRLGRREVVANAEPGDDSTECFTPDAAELTDGDDGGDNNGDNNGKNNGSDGAADNRLVIDADTDKRSEMDKRNVAEEMKSVSSRKSTKRRAVALISIAEPSTKQIRPSATCIGRDEERTLSRRSERGTAMDRPSSAEPAQIIGDVTLSSGSGMDVTSVASVFAATIDKPAVVLPPSPREAQSPSKSPFPSPAPDEVRSPPPSTPSSPSREAPTGYRAARAEVKCHECSLCERTFRFYHNLGRHMKNSHRTSIVAAEMGHGGAAEMGHGAAEVDGQIHRAATNGLRTDGRFTCKLCGHAFSFSSNLSRHKRLQHGADGDAVKVVKAAGDWSLHKCSSYPPVCIVT